MNYTRRYENFLVAVLFLTWGRRVKSKHKLPVSPTRR